MSFVDIFTTRIWYEHLSELSTFHAEWVSELKRVRADNPENKSYSVKNGWQGDVSLFQDSLFGKLGESVQQIFSRVLKEIAPDKNINFIIKAWANIQDQVGYNEAHVHPFSLFSAVYYLKVLNKSGRLCFKDPRLGLQNHIFATPTSPPPPNNYSTIKIQPQEGLLIIFPSWLEHFTEVNYDSAERISIAMNIDLGNQLKKLMLCLKREFLKI